VALLDAAPFAELSPQETSAARRHAERCESCGTAMAQIAALTAGLRSLPIPAASASFAAAVSARIARADAMRDPAPAEASAVARPLRALAAMAAGLLLIAMACRGLVTAARPVDLLMGRVGSIALGGAATAAHPLAAVVLMSGLCLCVYGLSAPFAPRAPRSRPS
jgi:anti-sigma factor RsiW